MTARTRFCLVLCGIAASVTALYAFQREFRVYASLEGYDNVPLPDDYRVPAEFVFGRLMYPPHPHARFSRPSVTAAARLARRRHQLVPGLSRAPTATRRTPSAA